MCAVRRWMSFVCIAALVGPCSGRGWADERQDRVDQSITRALEYLAGEQLPNGGWKVEPLGGESTSTTSLAVMAYLAAGHVPNEGPYGPVLERGIQYVLDHQQPDGLLFSRQGQGPMYCHGISALMLAEVCGMLEGKQAEECRNALEKAVTLILASQQVAKDKRNAGGWRYSSTSRDSDLSVTGWQLLALRAAKDIGCDVPAESIDKAVAYVRNCGHPNGGFGYQPGSSATTVLTGTGLTALQVCGAETQEESQLGANYLKTRPLKPRESWYFYGVYYCGVGGYKLGAAQWELLKPALYDELLSLQQPDGHWKGDNGNERSLGTIYPTAMAVLSLAVEYDYLPIYQR